MDFPNFLSLVGGQFELSLTDAARAAGLNYQTLLNKRHLGESPFPIHKRGKRLMVSAVDLHCYLFGQPKLVGRGRPSKVERLAAAASGLSVKEYRVSGKVGHVVT